MISTYRACPQKVWRGYFEGLAPMEESTHLVAGGAFAKGLEVTRKSYFDLGLTFEDAIALGGTALLAAYGAHETHTAKDALNMLGALGHYFEQWPIDQILIPYKPQGAAEHAIECRIAVPIEGTRHPTTGDPLIYGGRFDMMAIYKDSMLVGVDDKTTTQLGGQWIDRWKWNSQILGYAWGSRYLGHKLGAFVIRGTSLLKNNYGTAEPIQMIPEWKLDRFHTNLVRTVNKMVADWEAGVWDYNMGASCNAFGGCPFLLLCDTQTPEEWVAVNFTKRKWDPLASRD